MGRLARKAPTDDARLGEVLRIAEAGCDGYAATEEGGWVMAKQKAGNQRGRALPVTKPKATAIDDRLLAEINSEKVGGQSHDFADNAFWFSDPSEAAPPHDAGPPPKVKLKPKKYDALLVLREDWAWLSALDRLDRLGDARPLRQLKKVSDPSPRIKKYLDDLVERKAARERAKKGRGRRRLPAYTLSRNDALLLIACECVRGYVQRSHSVKTALGKVRDEWAWVPLNKSTLKAAYNVNHASLNRHLKRL